MHELVHVLGAIHPSRSDGDGTRFEVEEGTPGVMCKDSCGRRGASAFTLETVIDRTVIPGGPAGDFDPETDIPTGTIVDSMRFSDANKERILNLDYDQKDRGPEPPDGKNTDRNITSVAAAASNSE